MASLLGGEYCIDSLRQDVNDLQAILDDVHSRVGQVKYQSWKFPDKASCDVDVGRLLDRCQYNKEDDEECQMSHVMLYDVVIDRLVYLLQSFVCFNEILLNVANRSSQTSPSSASRTGRSIRSMSIGLTVKKCWGRITQIATLLQKLAKEVNSKPVSPIEEGTISPKLKKQQDDVVSKSILASDPLSDGDANADVVGYKDISCDVRTVSSQTHETAYTTCETCSRAQSCLNDVGRTIIDLCKSQNLPTALEDYQARYKEAVPMSVADLVRWGKHQTKDLSRICRHMSSLLNQVTPLKADLASVKKTEQQAKSELQRCQSVYERKETELREELRRREYRLKESEKDLKKKISTLESIRTGMQEELDKCQWKISDLKDELLQKHRDQLTMENSFSQLREEAIEGQQYKKDALKFKSELARVHDEFGETKNLLNHDRQLYERELTKNANMIQHEKMLQEKQRSLLVRMETITEDCEKMREQILTLEEEKDVAVVELEEKKKNHSDKQKTTMQHQDLANVQTDEIKSLQQSMESLRFENKDLRAAVNEYVERERLIVAYPDLNQTSVSSPMVQGSGDVLTDMGKQVEANVIRIQILEKENDALQKTLDKVNNTNEESYRAPSRTVTLDTTSRSGINQVALQENIYNQPIQLWKPSDLAFEPGRKVEELEISPEAEWYQNYQKSKSPQEKYSAKGQSSLTKPPSGRQYAQQGSPNKAHRNLNVPDMNGIRMDSGTSGHSSSSLEAYKKIKQQQMGALSMQSVRSSFTVGTGKRPKSGRPSSAKSAMFKPWT